MWARPTISRPRRSIRYELLECRLAMAAGPLVVTEVMYNPAPPTAAETAAGFVESDFEFVELQNLGDQSLLLGDYALSKGATYTFDPIILGAREHIVVVNNRAAFESRQGLGVPIAGEYTGNLSNNGDELILKNPAGQTTLSFKFSDAWYPSTDGAGRSLVIINPQAAANTWGQAASWRASDANGGSPGRIEGLIDTSPPSTPQSLTATLVTSTRVDLAWQASVDAQSGVRNYYIYRNGLLLGTSTLSTYSDLTVLPNSSYSYQISATNPFNVESPRSSVADIAIAPLGGGPTFAIGQALGYMIGTDAEESSGIAASRRNPGVLYVNNDGPSTGLYVINNRAQFLGKLTLAGVSSVDWEDIAIGPGPTAGMSYIYAGDIGDNNSVRPSISIYRVPEPSFDDSGGNQAMTLANDQFSTITLQYPNGSYDSETLLSDPLTGDLYVITKNLLVNRIYRAAAADLAAGGPVLLSLAGSVDFPVPSAGEISPNGREILIRNEDLAHLYVRATEQSVADALSGVPLIVPVVGTPTEPNGEAIAFDPAGSGYYTISEGISPPLYYFHRTSADPAPVAATSIVNRQVFYNHSAFDGGDGVADARDDLAIATDKQAFLPGNTATFANYTSYSRGLNGVMIDIVAAWHPPTLADFTFKVGNDSDPSGWAEGPAPESILVRAGAGVGGSDRVELVWPDHSITNTWLQTTVSAALGLATADVFYVGNAVGEGGGSNNAMVNSADELQARNHPRSFNDRAPIDFAFDYNRDGFVNAIDQIVARANATTLATALQLINVPSSARVAATGTQFVALQANGVAKAVLVPENLEFRPSAWIPEDVSRQTLAALAKTTEHAIGPISILSGLAAELVFSSAVDLNVDEHLYDLLAINLAETRLSSR